LGGLFAGIALKRLGHNVRILERNPSPFLQDQGAGIVTGAEMLQFVQRYDVTKTPIAVVSRARHYLNRKGEEIHVERKEQRMTSWDLMYNLLRANFDGDGAQGGAPSKSGNAKYDYGCRAVDITQDDAGAVSVSYCSRDGNQEKTPADLVIASDGGSSTARSILEPETKRTYAGYVAFRGTVLETELSESAKAALFEKFTFFHAHGIQILAYLIPGKHGTLEPGARLMNWVWYCNYPEDSGAFEELMTDVDGNRHRRTLPVDKMRPEIWEQQKRYASEVLPPQFAEIVCGTERPFVQAITDVLARKNVYLDGKLILMGDAVAGLRPHTAASTSQAAKDAMAIVDMIEGKTTMDEMKHIVMEYGKKMQQHGVDIGNRSQFGEHPLSE